jgi:hypothetical protein
LFANKYQLAEPRLGLVPKPVPVDREPIVYPMKNGSAGRAVNPKNALGAIDMSILAEGAELAAKLV